MGCAGSPGRRFRRGGGCLPTHGHIGLGGGLAGAVHCAAARSMTGAMGGAGRLAGRPCSCRAGLCRARLFRRGGFRRRSCRAGAGIDYPRCTRRRRAGRAGWRHIAVGLPGSRGHGAFPGLLGPPAAPGSVCRSAAGMFLLGRCLGRIFLPGAGLLGGTLLAGTVVGIPAAAMRAAKALGAVPGPTVPPTTSKGAPAAKGIVRPSSILRSAPRSLAAVGASAAPGAAEPPPAAGGGHRGL